MGFKVWFSKALLLRNMDVFWFSLELGLIQWPIGIFISFLKVKDQAFFGYITKRNFKKIRS